MTRILSVLEFLLLASAVLPLRRLWLAVYRTALLSACWWAVLATGIWMLAGLLGALEPEPGEWVALGHLRLMATAFSLAPLVAVLGARRPGARAWNLIVLTLLVVFSLPGLQQWLLGRTLEPGRVGMDGPRFAFYWIVAAIALINYLPTRFAPATLLVTLALLAQTIAVGPWSMDARAVACLSASAGVLLSAGAWLASALRPKTGPTGVQGAWLRLRDGWGVVWALRFSDRWNAAAKQYDWPFRLHWSGFSPVEPEAPKEMEGLEPKQLPVPAPAILQQRILDDVAEAHFRYLLRRFADPDEFIGPEKQGAGVRDQESGVRGQKSEVGDGTSGVG